MSVMRAIYGRNFRLSQCIRAFQSRVTVYFGVIVTIAGSAHPEFAPPECPGMLAATSRMLMMLMHSTLVLLHHHAMFAHHHALVIATAATTHGGPHWTPAMP